MATNKDTENNSPSAPAPADKGITMLTKVTEQDLAEAIVDEDGAKYSKDGKRLLKTRAWDWKLEDVDFKHYAIKEGTEIICKEAFLSCENLASIIIPPSVNTLGEGAFSRCSRLTSVTIPEHVTTIGKDAFFRCVSLTSINMPESVTNIGEGAFWGCESLTSITIPESVTSIGSGTVNGCSGLTSLTLPDGITSIGEYAFFIGVFRPL